MPTSDFEYEYETLSARKFDAGKLYASEQLPENEMNSNGKPEWLDDDLLAVFSDGTMLEFRHAFECTAVYEIREENGTVGDVYSGEPR